ncbi:hypothetical protein OAO53_00905 [Gammaproteobacteria bacterium]|jgi:hypothetical protein|nr:hypothetical protein [Gammaproteobacteria bacterium]MDC0536189.1 hypothetical protein [Gammaproteobacteria bacterium]MDC1149312.1 hypothetical protein [Gammaproteobacteria bacterium]
MDISFIGWIHTLIALIAILSGAYSLKKYTIIETKNFSAKIFIVTTIFAAITALLIYKRGFGVGHLLAIITLLAVIFGYINERGLFFGFLTPYFQTVSYSALFLFHMIPGITEILRRFPLDNPIVIDSNVDHPILISFYITFFISYLIITTNQIIWLQKRGI